ncbi:fructosamine kinase family protein [Calothrix sp. NIES-3974]|uniref:fructosamine kinase family protein n=1 Tax=Calothrix sp. NIES-3974 TaxID=2005462 RepID=UPI000B601E90|nr:fructosamine kinase family protein [Calothrix sp. NIES-3974]BAZ06728.1 aminoglycoside phosphotransferase [Calothrix sp. NIES-3974]
MWKDIDLHISKIQGKNFQTHQRRSLSGGCINQSYTISDGDNTYFVKVNQASQVAMFEAEYLGLQEIFATKTIRVPQPIAWGISGTQSYLILEYLGMGGGDNNSWQKMGWNLAAMHRVTSNQGFGWQRDNTIGSTPQINTWNPSWIEFYTQQRLAYQFKLAHKRGARFPLADKLLASIADILSGHEVTPSLVHGDLWGGNAGFSAEGEPVIFDPATYYGDREVDIAMTELFGGFPRVFYQAYQEAYPLEAGYERRKILYNLYHILNHFNLFGGSYASQANRMIEQLVV